MARSSLVYFFIIITLLFASVMCPPLNHYLIGSGIRCGGWIGRCFQGNGGFETPFLPNGMPRIFRNARKTLVRTLIHPRSVFISGHLQSLWINNSSMEFREITVTLFSFTKMR